MVSTPIFIEKEPEFKQRDNFRARRAEKRKEGMLGQRNTVACFFFHGGVENIARARPVLQGQQCHVVLLVLLGRIIDFTLRSERRGKRRNGKSLHMGGREEYAKREDERGGGEERADEEGLAFCRFPRVFFPELIHRAPGLFCDPDSWESGQVFWG